MSFVHIYVCVVGLHVHIDLRLTSSIYLRHSLPYYALRHAPHCTWNSWFQLVWLVSMIWLFSVSASQWITGGLPGSHLAFMWAQGMQNPVFMFVQYAKTSPQSDLEFLMLINVDM